MNSVGTEGGMNLGGGENEASSEGGNTQPEKEAPAEQTQNQQQQQQQGGWNQPGWENIDYNEYDMRGSWYPLEYGAWTFTKEEPKEEWKVVEGNKNGKKRTEVRMIGSIY